MGRIHLVRGAFAVTLAALAVMAVCARSSAQTEHNDEFVQRAGTKLLKRPLTTFAFLFASSAFAAPNLTGQWTIHNSIAGNESDLRCKLAVTGNKITGTCQGQDKDRPVTGGVDGNEVTWQYQMEYNGSTLTLIYRATLDDSGKIAGTVEVQPYGVTGDFSATPGWGASPAASSPAASPSGSSESQAGAGQLGSDQAATVPAQIPHNDEFVQRDGTRLTLGGETFRFSGPNIEWLGLEGYGPLDPLGPHYPSHFEVDDALDTAKMMGARVIRSQTMGDSIGCDLCIEPKLGQFNPEAFKQLDYVLKAAHDRGLRLIFTLVGDNAYADGGGIAEYVKGLPRESGGLMGSPTFFKDPKAIERFEEHIAALLNHKNSLTGIAYKDDPTILAWEDCNACGGGGSLKWVDTIGSFIKSIDKNHLFEDNGAIFDKNNSILDSKTVDIFTTEYYPHWDALFGAFMSAGGYTKTTAEVFSLHAERAATHGKVYVANEYGWDDTDWPAPADLQKVLTTMKNDPKISGDLYWALQAHNEKFGWQPIPANVPSKKYSLYGESGQWWALYYGGIDTAVMTKEDMAARAEMLRAHAFDMAGVPVPPHAVPPAPVITVKGLNVIGWRGSAGAVKYSVERKTGANWELVCAKCATDADTPWVDAALLNGPLKFGKYRVTAYNADGVASPPSAER